jgi:hypothetical protein
VSIVVTDKLDASGGGFANTTRIPANLQISSSYSGTGGVTRGHVSAASKAAREAGYRLGSDRGSPNHGSTLASKRVMAQIRSPASVST